MTVRPQRSDSSPSIAVVLIDDDIIFRTGLRVWLDQDDTLTVIGEADRERSAVALLERITQEPPRPDGRLVVVIGRALNRMAGGDDGGLSLCQAVRRQFASLPIAVVGAPVSSSVLADLRQAGANGYALKTDAPEVLLNWLKTIATSASTWETTAHILAPQPETTRPPRLPRAIATPLSILKRNVQASGIQQIDAVLAELQGQLDYSALETLDRLILEGRCRELRAARWMVQVLLGSPSPSVGDSTPDPGSEPPAFRGDRQGRLSQSSNRAGGDVASGGGGGTVSRWRDMMDNGGAIIAAGVEAALFEGAALKLQGSLRNVSEIPLEIDILREDKKRELLFLIVRNLKQRLDVLRQSQVTPRQIIEGRSRILRDLWQSVADDFFGRYYAVQVEGLEVEVVTLLEEDAALAQAEILDAIPDVSEFLAHLLFHDPLTIDSVTYAPGTPEAMIRAEALMDHLMIQVANSVIQPLLNRLGDVEIVKQGFYDRSLISSREMARFRNNLSWRYRLDKTVRDPINIFESRYQLFTIQGNGIRQTAIYAPRQDQLEALSGFPFLVTLALEFRDAIAPRVRAVVSFVGSGLIYVLTDVIGRGIGLVVRGVIKGIGSALQDTRWSRDVGQRRL
jgi:DNA-binding NarL/FixJ family response regulator